jgi:N-acetyl sugar amidotransferase
MMRPYQICTRCVMDTTDEEIEFSADGVCNHCRRFDAVASKSWFPNEEGARRLNAILERIKADGRGREYDCVLGLSGGVDSCYLALKAKDWGLRPLVIHVDGGWNSELAVANIEQIVKHCGYDLHTHVVDWEEMRDLQLAYLRSGVSNQDVPQDHVFFAGMYHFAVKHGIRYVLSGGNIATEGVFPASWHGDAMDKRNLLAIHSKYGERPLRTYTTIGFFKYFAWYPFVRRLRTIRPLNFMPYNKAEALKELEATVGWRAYPRKHGESLFTRFFQNHYLPAKFGYDKRRPHLSSLIVSGQMTRAEALAKLEEPLYDPAELEADMAFFCKKMQISRAEAEALLNAPVHHYSEFRNQDRWYRALKRIQSGVERISGRRVNVYS